MQLLWLMLLLFMLLLLMLLSKAQTCLGLSMCSECM